LAITAIALIQDEAPKARLLIYGIGAELPRLVSLANELGLNGKVKFYDIVPLSEVAAIMSEADLGVVPKRAESFGNEAFSTKILEFMAVGVPVLASDTKIDKYYFDDSSICFFGSGNEKELAASMLRLMNDSSLRMRIMAGGRAKADEYSWDRHKHRYFELVDALTDRTSAPADRP
jgi:glycosyltransferase involved in cell wall biosynthesis